MKDVIDYLEIKYRKLYNDYIDCKSIGDKDSADHWKVQAHKFKVAIKILKNSNKLRSVGKNKPTKKVCKCGKELEPICMDCDYPWKELADGDNL